MQVAYGSTDVIQPHILVENVEYLIGVGTHALSICLRMGTNPQAISSRLREHGRDDLAAYFDIERMRIERGRAEQ